MNTGVQNSGQQSRAEVAPVAIVTGASSGIGRAFARLLAADGYDLLLTATDAEGLAEVASRLEADHGVATVAVAVDLSLPDASDRIFAELSSWGRTANALINNAGFNVYGRFEDTDLERELEMIRLHLIAPTVMTKRFLRLRDQSQRNLILNVSSVAAFVPGPAVSVHFATRAHLFSFSIALHDEFRGTDVQVSCLCPGPTRTAFFGRAGMKQVRLASGWPMQLMEAEDVAAAGYRALKAGKRFVVPGLRNRMFSLAARMAPRSIATQFTRWIMQEVPGGPE